MPRLRELLRFEHRREPLAPTPTFVRRVVLVWLVVAIASAAVLGLGTLGYHCLAGLPWVDALLEAALILGGMGPLHPLPTAGAKLFAAAYALFCGLFAIAAIGAMLSPILHRIAHRLHIEEPPDIAGR